MHRLEYLDHLVVCLESQSQHDYTTYSFLQKQKEPIYQHCTGCSQSAGPSVNNFSCFSFFSNFFLSFLCSQLSVGWYSSVSLYSCNWGRKAARPPMLAVFRSSGAWSEGGTHRRGGRGAKSARRFGGSLSVILKCRVLLQEMNEKLGEHCLMENRSRSRKERKGSCRKSN